MAESRHEGGEPFEGRGEKRASDAKMSDETRREIFGGSGREQGPGGRKPGEEEDEQREYSSASESGKGERLGQIKGTKD
jgi:hypothetical protein